MIRSENQALSSETALFTRNAHSAQLVRMVSCNTSIKRLVLPFIRKLVVLPDIDSDKYAYRNINPDVSFKN